MNQLNTPSCVIYARTSSGGSQADRQHPDNQLGPLRTFATSQGWQVVQEFIDRDSGTKSDRPGFKAMMEAAGKHEFDHVVFWSLDRVTRNGALDALQILNKLTHWRVGYRSLQEPYIDSASPFADVLIALLGTVARLERDRLRERIAAGLARAKEKGTASGREIGRPRIVLDRDRLASLRARGLSWSKISKVTGHKITTIRMALKAYRKPCGNLPAKEPS